VQSGLIVLQVAVSAVLLIGAGLLLTSLYRLQRVDPGYRVDRVIAAEAFPNFTKYAQPETQVRFYEEAIRRIESEPGVVAVAVTNAVPLSAITPGPSPVLIKGETDAASERRPTADVRVASPGYFAILGVPLDGRDFAAADRPEGAPVAIVNRAMTKYWEKGSPIGARISLDNGDTWATVIAIAADVKLFGLERETGPQVFVPLTQAGGLAGRFLVRTEGDPLAIAQALRTHIHAVDPDMPIKNVATLGELRRQSLATPKLTALLLTVFAALALVVTIAGISGVIAISVTHRLEEFGVRMALGASRPQILRQVIGQGVSLVGAGLIAGIALSFAATKVLSAYLFATTATDPLTLAFVCVTFLAAGVLSCLGPAWRATSADPLTALRAD
jgi:ABC-type antimicrobial peptide transport system, permease component